MEMWFGGGATTTFVRNFCRKAAPNLRKINPKVPPQEASAIAESLYLLLKQHGPLTVSNTWNHVKVLSLLARSFFFWSLRLSVIH